MSSRVRWGRTLRQSIVAAAVLSAMLAVSLITTQPGRETGGPLPNGSPRLPDEQVTVDGKVYTKTARSRVRLSAKDFEATHDGIAEHATGRGFMPNVNWAPFEPAYGGANDWWVEGETYILHRQEVLGNPPVNFNYYRAGFRAWSWRGLTGAYDQVWGDEETPSANNWQIYFALVQHPIGGTLTTNLSGPWSTGAGMINGTAANYTCDNLTDEVYRADDPTMLIRANLWIRPRFMYLDHQLGQFRPNPYGQTRRILTSRGLVADGTDQQYPETYDHSWSDYVAIPGGVHPETQCAPEPLQEP